MLKFSKSEYPIPRIPGMVFKPQAKGGLAAKFKFTTPIEDTISFERQRKARAQEIIHEATRELEKLYQNG